MRPKSIFGKSYFSTIPRITLRQSDKGRKKRELCEMFVVCKSRTSRLRFTLDKATSATNVSALSILVKHHARYWSPAPPQSVFAALFHCIVFTGSSSTSVAVEFCIMNARLLAPTYVTIWADQPPVRKYKTTQAKLDRPLVQSARRLGRFAANVVMTNSAEHAIFPQGGNDASHATDRYSDRT